MPVDHRQEYELCSLAAKRLRESRFGDAACVIQTGSGLRAPDLGGRRTLLFSEVPGMPRATAPGHVGAFHHGWWREVPVLILEGRLHLYEGHSAAEAIRPIRAAGLLGLKCAILSNAAGGVREGLRTGDVVRVIDHVNVARVDPLVGIHDARFGDRFPITAGRSHDEKLGHYAVESAAAHGVAIASGVYGYVAGPSFETPAEVRMLRTLGVDVVGMSTVPEVLAAAQMRMRVLVLSLVANPAGVVPSDATAETEVLAAGERFGIELTKIVEGVVARIEKERNP